VLFFIADVLQAESRQGLFLALYFVAAQRACRCGSALGGDRQGARMGDRDAGGDRAFVWAAFLGPGDVVAFAIICALSGWRSAPISRCRRRSSPTSSTAAGRWRRPARTSASGRSPPSSTWRLPRHRPAPARDARLHPGASDAAALGALAFVYAAVPAPSSSPRRHARLVCRAQSRG